MDVSTIVVTPLRYTALFFNISSTDDTRKQTDRYL